MAKTGQMTLRCGYPDCVNEPRSEQERSAQPGYCGRPDPVTGEPHTALTAFRRRQTLAEQGGGAPGPDESGRAGFGLWGRRRRAEAELLETRMAACEADARLAEAVAGKAAAEQEVAAAESRAGEAERAAAERVAAVRRDAAREQAELRAGLEAQIAVAEEARAGLVARVEQAEAEAGQARSAVAEADARLAEAASQAAEAESRADETGQAAARARDVAESANAEHAEAERRDADADRDDVARPAARQQPKATTRRRRSRGT